MAGLLRGSAPAALLPGATDLATYGKFVFSGSRARRRRLGRRDSCSELLAYKSALERDVLGYEGK